MRTAPRLSRWSALTAGLFLALSGCNSDSTTIIPPPNDSPPERPPPAAGIWTSTTAMPLAVSVPGTAASDGAVFVAGGWAGGDPPLATDRVFRFDPGTGAWTEQGEMRRLTVDLRLVPAGDELYAVGGLRLFEAGGGLPLGLLQVYDPEADQWNTLPPPPDDRTEPAVAALDGKIYVLGGQLDETLIYDIATASWSSGAPVPLTRLAPVAHVVGGRIYLFGGRTSAGAPRTGSVIYDRATDSWSAGPAPPRVREAVQSARLGDRIHFFGGWSQGAGATGVSDDHWAFDLTTESWIDYEPMPRARAEGHAVRVGDRIYLLGGRQNRVITSPPISAVDVFEEGS